jgi:glycerophosphoryl diester phosphodiesterase
MKQLTAVIFLFLTTQIVDAQVKFIGHRGASYLAPENTVASNKLAWKLGADAVELDIHLSKDNRVMVIHDGNTKRVSGENHKVSETSSKILRKLDVGSYKGKKYEGEKIPFLGELIKLIPPGKQLVVELKSHQEIIPWMKKSIEKYGKLNQLVFICFDWNTILEVKKTFPSNTCYWLCSSKEKLIKKIKDVSRAGLAGVDLKENIIDREVMEETNRYNLDVVAWTVNDPSEAKRLIDLGVEGLTTNRPAWLKEQVQGM